LVAKIELTSSGLHTASLHRVLPTNGELSPLHHLSPAKSSIESHVLLLVQLGNQAEVLFFAFMPFVHLDVAGVFRPRDLAGELGLPKLPF
jgi:hypothetical protein